MTDPVIVLALLSAAAMFASGVVLLAVAASGPSSSVHLGDESCWVDRGSFAVCMPVSDTERCAGTRYNSAEECYRAMSEEEGLGQHVDISKQLEEEARRQM